MNNPQNLDTFGRRKIQDQNPSRETPATVLASSAGGGKASPFEAASQEAQKYRAPNPRSGDQFGAGDGRVVKGLIVRILIRSRRDYVAAFTHWSDDHPAGGASGPSSLTQPLLVRRTSDLRWRVFQVRPRPLAPH